MLAKCYRNDTVSAAFEDSGAAHGVTTVSIRNLLRRRLWARPEEAAALVGKRVTDAVHPTGFGHWEYAWLGLGLGLGRGLGVGLGVLLSTGSTLRPSSNPNPHPYATPHPHRVPNPHPHPNQVRRGHILTLTLTLTRYAAAIEYAIGQQSGGRAWADDVGIAPQCRAAWPPLAPHNLFAGSAAGSTAVRASRATVCAFAESLKPYVLRASGFQYAVERNKQGLPKPGYVATSAGAELGWG